MAIRWLSSSYTHKVNLESYLARIEYAGSTTVTIETLRQLQWHHMLAIPYEILDIHHIGKVDLDPESVELKMVTNGCGGFCYEHNTLFMHVLLAMGFDVTPVNARTRWQKPDEVMSPLTHLVLIVKVGGRRWLCDVGFSVCCAPVPLDIDTEAEQDTPLERHRVVKHDEYYAHQMLSQGVWQHCFFFSPICSYPIDWEMGSCFMSTHQTSPLTKMLLFAIVTPTCRYRLLNKELSARYLDGTVDTKTIDTETEYIHVLKTIFKLRLPDSMRICPPGMTW